MGIKVIKINNDPVPDWKIHNVSTKSVYPKGIFYFKNKYSIRSTEGIISSNNEQIPIQLLDPHAIARDKQKYRYIHIFQVNIRPLAFKGVNGSISLFLRDKRLLDFNGSLLNVPQSSEIDDPFNFFPNFMVSLQEIDILHHLTLTVKFHDLQMIENCYPLALMYKIHYKWIGDQPTPTAKSSGPGIETIFRQTNMRSPNDMTIIIIKRSDIQFPEDFNLHNEIPEEQGYNSHGWINIPGGRIQIQFPQRNFGESS
ncbi:hypothetical protein ACOSP7_019715 [Xanthoceras sorbifolium]